MTISIDRITSRSFSQGTLVSDSELVADSLLSLQNRESMFREISLDLFRKQAYEIIGVAERLGYSMAEFSFRQQSTLRKPDAAILTLHRDIPDDSDGVTEYVFCDGRTIRLAIAKRSKNGAARVSDSGLTFSNPAGAIKYLQEKSPEASSLSPVERYCIAKRSRRDPSVFVANSFHSEYPNIKLKEDEAVIQYSGTDRTHAPISHGSKNMVKVVRPTIRKAKNVD